MALNGGLRRALKLGAVGAAAALALSACGSSPSSTPTSKTTTTVAPAHFYHGGTVQWALPPQVAPNYIFPFSSLSYFSVTNLTQFQYLMYRPLYWFGQITTPAPTVNYSLSLADAPVWSNGNKTVTITLKGWKFSNGQKVDAQSVIFWMNMMKAEKTNWAGYVPGDFPDNVVSYSASSPTSNTVTFNLNAAYSTNWFLYNEMSQIDPMPEAWDITSLTGAPGSGKCGVVEPGKAMTGKSTTAACTKVWTFDTDNNGTTKTPQMAADPSTYATNKVWQVVDGPWRLAAFSSAHGEATFVPNTSYSGPQRPIIKKFIEVPFTSDTAEFGALSTNSIQMGYLPPENSPPNSGPPGSVGQNASQLTAGYNLVTSLPWQINYFPENFNSTGDNGQAGAIFNQAYFRQAIQHGVDQTGIIRAFDKGYGVPTYGPVPAFPSNPFVSTAEKSNPFPYSVSAGTALLKSHGWTIKSGGTDTCANPGTGANQCGAGISKGAALSFSEIYASGSPSLTQTVQNEVGAWSKMGIQMATKALPFNSVLAAATPCKKGPKCTWEFANWGGGWIFSPDYLPTGGELFSYGAGSNSGNFNNAQNNANITATHHSSSMSVFDNYENYLAKQLPVVFQPIATSTGEVSKNLGGTQPANALMNLTPEYWYYIHKP
ncbi:MAG: ABC transporter substrate-binding protein [Acidimicrobiales bacterium]